MNTNRLSSAIQACLNKQVTKEANAAQTYLSYAIWADSEGYAGVADLLFRHAAEERSHMMKFVKYIQERGSKTIISALDSAPADPRNLKECFDKLFQHEVSNTTSIYEIVTCAQEEKDWATWNFTQWFVKEQIEEETFVLNLIDKLKIAGGENASNDALFYLDNKIGQLSDEASLARDAEEDGQE